MAESHEEDYVIARKEIGVIMVTEPKKFDMGNPLDVKRWFLEMEGYLHACNFIHQGTDFEGRCFAMDGFRQLRVKMFKEANKELGMAEMKVE